MMKKGHESLRQLVKYGVVGVMNTCVTLVAIFVCKAVLGINPYLSNAIGYALGIVNSFLWNRSWVFHSGGKVQREAVLFLVGTGFCYCVQLLSLYGLTEWTSLGARQWHIAGYTLGGYGVATLMASVVYTAANFIYNKLVAFRG